MKWIKLKDRKPSSEIDGSKILIYRTTNESQSDMSISIFDTNMIRFCDINETYWMALPNKPQK